MSAYFYVGNNEDRDETMTLTSTQHADDYQQIHDDIIQLLDTARTETVRTINALMTATYWEIGRRIVEFEQGGARAAYGTQLIERLSVDLSQRYKRGFSTGNLRQMRMFYLYFQGIEIQKTVSGESPNIIHSLKRSRFPGQLTYVFLRLKMLKRALFMKKRRYVTAGRYDSSTDKSPLSFTNER